MGFLRRGDVGCVRSGAILDSIQRPGRGGQATHPPSRQRFAAPRGGPRMKPPMRISVPTEPAPRELRVALTPDSVARLVKAGLQAAVQRGAGVRAGFSDEAYAAAGAMLAPDFPGTVAGAAIVAKVQPPSDDEVARLEPSTVLVSLMQPGRNDGLPARLAARNVTALALELVPRITRAQTMDVLSSQSTVAGYKAVLVGAAELDKFLPMLTTAAGNVTPAKVFVIGAGVA